MRCGRTKGSPCDAKAAPARRAVRRGHVRTAPVAVPASSQRTSGGAYVRGHRRGGRCRRRRHARPAARAGRTVGLRVRQWRDRQRRPRTRRLRNDRVDPDHRQGGRPAGLRPRPGQARPAGTPLRPHVAGGRRTAWTAVVVHAPTRQGRSGRVQRRRSRGQLRDQVLDHGCFRDRRRADDVLGRRVLRRAHHRGQAAGQQRGTVRHVLRGPGEPAHRPERQHRRAGGRARRGGDGLLGADPGAAQIRTPARPTAASSARRSSWWSWRRSWPGTTTSTSPARSTRTPRSSTRR